MQRFYPIVCTDTVGVKFEVNFGQDNFRFDIDQYLITEANKTFDAINRVDIPKNTLFDIVSYYLYLHGHHGALVSLESSYASERSPTIESLKKNGPLSSVFFGSSESNKVKLTNSSPTDDKRVFMPEKDKSFLSALKKLFNKSASSSEYINEDDQKANIQKTSDLSDETAFIERSMIRKAIIRGKLEEAKNLLGFISPTIFNSHLGMQAMFLSLEFIRLYEKDHSKSLIFAKQNFSCELKCQKIQYLDSSKKVQHFELRV